MRITSTVDVGEHQRDIDKTPPGEALFGGPTRGSLELEELTGGEIGQQV